MIGKVFLSVIAIACFHGACATLTSDESIAACDANSCPERKSLLQAKSRPTSVSFVAHTKSHKVSHVADTKSACQLDISGDPDATGNTATLDEAGFMEVKACSCPAQMREFIRRLVLADSNEVCHEGGLEGLTLFYYSYDYPENDFTSLKAGVGPGGAAQTDTTCPWIAPTGQCDSLNFGSCPSFPGATNPPCIGCTISTTTASTTTTSWVPPKNSIDHGKWLLVHYCTHCGYRGSSWESGLGDEDACGERCSEMGKPLLIFNHQGGHCACYDKEDCIEDNRVTSDDLDCQYHVYGNGQ